MERRTAAIILAAGKGTRMKSEKPKVIFDLAGKPLINRVLATAISAGSDPIVIVVGYKKENVIEIVPEDDRIIFAEQKEQNGTGHAVMVTSPHLSRFQGDVFILCGDVPLLRAETLTRMLEIHRSSQSACTVLTAVLEDAKHYGRIVRDESGNVSRITEYRDAGKRELEIREINTGIYCFDSQMLFNSLNRIDNSNSQGEFYLTDTIEVLSRSGYKVTSVVLDDIVEAAGVNSREQLKQLEDEFLTRKVDNPEVDQ